MPCDLHFSHVFQATLFFHIAYIPDSSISIYIIWVNRLEQKENCFPNYQQMMTISILLLMKYNVVNELVKNCIKSFVQIKVITQCFVIFGLLLWSLNLAIYFQCFDTISMSFPGIYHTNMPGCNVLIKLINAHYYKL